MSEREQPKNDVLEKAISKLDPGRSPPAAQEIRDLFTQLMDRIAQLEGNDHER